jgi:hypothetical protein
MTDLKLALNETTKVVQINNAPAMIVAKYNQATGVQEADEEIAINIDELITRKAQLTEELAAVELLLTKCGVVSNIASVKLGVSSVSFE